MDAGSVDRVRTWLRKAWRGMAWLTGTTGSGMTTMVTRLIRELDLEAVWLTASTVRNRAFLKDVCSGAIAVNGKRKVLVMDELDVLLGSEASMVDVTSLTKQNTKVPIICVLKQTRAALTNDLRKKASLVVDFPPPTHEAMVEAVRGTAVREGLSCELVDRLCAAAPGDIRHVLQTLRASMDKTRTIGMQTADAVATILSDTVGVARALSLFSADPHGLSSGLFETYWQTTDDVSECIAYLDMVSIGDTVNERIQGKQCWELHDVYGAMTTCSAAVLLPTTAGIKLDRYGTIWNKNYAHCSKLKQVKSVALHRWQQGCAHLTPMDMGYVRRMVLACLPNVEKAADMARLACLDAGACLHVMRLWDCGYKLGTHARVRRLLDGRTPREPSAREAPPGAACHQT